MIIKSPKYTRNFLLLKKGGFKLFQSNKSQKNNLSPNYKTTISYKEGRTNIYNDKEEKNKNILNTFSYTSKSMHHNSPKNLPKLNEYKKRLFLKNIISSEKKFILEDYMKHKEIDLIKNHNIKTVHEARKTFFSERKINDNRTSYFYKEELFDKNNKFPLMIKDIQSNYILLKNKRNKKYKEYFIFKQLEEEKNSFKDFNEKLGVKNIYIKSDKLFNKNKTFMNKNFNFISCINYFNSFSTTHKGAFNLKRKSLK